MTGKTLLVTGAAGFIGSALVRAALQEGHRVVGFDALTYAGNRDNIAGLCPLVIGRIENPRDVETVLREVRPDAVMNLAAESHVDRSIAGPRAFLSTNIVGTFSLLEQVLSYSRETFQEGRGFRYLQISTDEVFGSLEGNGHFSESSPYRPNSPYAASKAAADHLVRSWHKTYGLSAIVTHCSNNYGPRQYPEKLIPTAITAALSGRVIPVYGTGKNVRDWIHVDDHARGLLLALSLGNEGETYCFGGATEVENIALVQTICDTLDALRPRADSRSYRDQIKFVEDRPGHDWRYAVDSTRAAQELGFAPRVSFQIGLRDTVKWYLENPEWVHRVQSRTSSPPVEAHV